MRIQYKDDEQTFVTMTCDEDFEDALRCVEPIPNYEDAYRLTIRIDDSLTPTLKSPAKKKPCITIRDELSTKTTSAKAKSEDPNFPSSKSKKRLNFRKNEFESTEHEFKGNQETEQYETPLQRYITSCQTKIDAKLEVKRELVEEMELLNMKINDAKSLNVGKGSLCHNCHLRAGHTARNCTLERCQTVYSCGQDKHHQGEVAKRRELEQSIHKLEKEIAQLSYEMQNRKTSAEKVQNSFSHQIELALLEESEETYQENGYRNWQRLRKHVYALQGYCKKHLNGKLPPKHELKTVLSHALDEVPKPFKNDSLRQSKHAKKTPRENPFKSVLENRGVKFPSQSSASDSDDDPPRYMPTTKEEEDEQLQIALLASANIGNRAPSPPSQPTTAHHHPQTPPPPLPPPPMMTGAVNQHFFGGNVPFLHPYYVAPQVQYPAQRHWFQDIGTKQCKFL